MSTDSSDPNLTSLSLLERAAADDQQAWVELSQRYGGLVYHWCRKSGLSSNDAADVFQEVFRAVARNLSNFHRDAGAGGFRAWLWTITRNKLRDFARASNGKARAAGGTSHYDRLLQLPEEELIELSQSSQDAESALVAQKLELIRSEFRPKTFEAFYRVTVENHPVEMVAEELGLSAASVYQAKSRVLHRLRTELGDGGP